MRRGPVGPIVSIVAALCMSLVGLAAASSGEPESCGVMIETLGIVANDAAPGAKASGCHRFACAGLDCAGTFECSRARGSIVDLTARATATAGHIRIQGWFSSDPTPVCTIIGALPRCEVARTGFVPFGEARDLRCLLTSLASVTVWYECVATIA